jgi:hypothetical protein
MDNLTEGDMLVVVGVHDLQKIHEILLAVQNLHPRCQFRELTLVQYSVVVCVNCFKE